MRILITRLLALLLLPFYAQAGLVTHIEKSSDNTWTLTYQVSSSNKALFSSQSAALNKTEAQNNATVSNKITRIGFSRNPNDARISRWLPLDEDIQIIYQDQQEWITSKSGKPFSQARFKLTPIYQHLGKDYAPFSPFSDGGTLFHSGRFFACINACKESDNAWDFILNAPKNDHIIHNGKVHTDTYRWQDSDSGQNIYVGKQTPLLSQHFIGIIDPALPTKMREALRVDLPKMMVFLNQAFGISDSLIKPSLFASYSNQKGGSSQGGTLPNQIFMHWDRNDLERVANDPTFLLKTLWFFAHEAAHLHQEMLLAPISESTFEFWLHEGHAEFMAHEVLATLYPAASDYLEQRVKQINQRCAKGLSQYSLQEAAKQKQFQLHYQCGFLIHQAINQRFSAEDSSAAITLWSAFKKAEKSDISAKGVRQYLSVIQQQYQQDISEEITLLTTSKFKTEKTFFHALAQLKNVQ